MTRRPSPRAAFSLPEILIVIAAIAILATVAIPVLTGVQAGAERAAAERHLGLLNKAVTAHNNVNRELSPAVFALDTGGSDEAYVVGELQERDPSSPGSPYLQAGLNLGTTDSSETYRAVWSGRFFELREPGEPGVGIDLRAFGDSVN